MTPQSVGVAESKLIMGKHSGRHALSVKLKELGYDLSREDLNKAYYCFTRLADSRKEVSDSELASIVENRFEISGKVDEKLTVKAARIKI